MLLKLTALGLLIAGGTPNTDANGNATAPNPGAAFAEVKTTVRTDPPPEEITRGRHYVNSDERRHDLFHDAIANRGGMLIGVGAGQNYVLAGWVEPEAMVVVDFDQVIVDIHSLFDVVLRNTNTPKEFIAAWRHENRIRTLRWFRDAFPKRAEPKPMRELFIEYRDNLSWGFKQTLERMTAQGQRTYLDDQGQFDTVKRLVTEGRVLAIRGDFTGRRTLTDVAGLARKLDLEVSTLYLSNIEQYFAWRQGHYRANMLGLPLDDDTVVLRAYGVGEEFAADHNYRYYFQSGSNFHAWLRDPTMESVRSLFPAGERADTAGFFEVRILPGQLDEHRRQKRKLRRGREQGKSELADASAR